LLERIGHQPHAWRALDAASSAASAALTRARAALVRGAQNGSRDGSGPSMREIAAILDTRLRDVRNAETSGEAARLAGLAAELEAAVDTGGASLTRDLVEECGRVLVPALESSGEFRLRAVAAHTRVALKAARKLLAEAWGGGGTADGMSPVDAAAAAAAAQAMLHSLKDKQPGARTGTNSDRGASQSVAAAALRPGDPMAALLQPMTTAAVAPQAVSADPLQDLFGLDVQCAPGPTFITPVQMHGGPPLPSGLTPADPLLPFLQPRRPSPLPQSVATGTPVHVMHVAANSAPMSLPPGVCVGPHNSVVLQRPPPLAPPPPQPANAPQIATLESLRQPMQPPSVDSAAGLQARESILRPMQPHCTVSPSPPKARTSLAQGHAGPAADGLQAPESFPPPMQPSGVNLSQPGAFQRSAPAPHTPHESLLKSLLVPMHATSKPLQPRRRADHASSSLPTQPPRPAQAGSAVDPDNVLRPQIVPQATQFLAPAVATQRRPEVPPPWPPATPPPAFSVAPEVPRSLGQCAAHAPTAAVLQGLLVEAPAAPSASPAPAVDAVAVALQEARAGSTGGEVSVGRGGNADSGKAEDPGLGGAADKDRNGSGAKWQGDAGGQPSTQTHGATTVVSMTSESVVPSGEENAGTAPSGGEDLGLELWAMLSKA
jgi:hypothetical protein